MQMFRREQMKRGQIGLLWVAMFAALAGAAQGQYAGWQHSGSLYILTTPEGANLPATAVETNFPMLVRLDKDGFDFSQARPGGEDIRFSTGDAPLAYQIEEWDAARGIGLIWVRVPVIRGGAQQEIKLHWGKADAAGESSGAAVFNAANGYAAVLHMDDTLKDEAGSITPVNAGSTATAGLIGSARHFVSGRGINGGDHITNFPFSDSPFTSEGWFRAEVAGAAMFGWGRYATRYNGKTGDGNEVVICFASPPGLEWGSDGPGGARATDVPVTGRWYHVAATYSNGTSQIFVNGVPAGRHHHPAAMSLMNDIGMTIGGLRGTYQFSGDIDELRVSRVARSADWLKLEYENQKEQQTLVGPLVQPGNEFSVEPSAVTTDEGRDVSLTARAGGARKTYWIMVRDGVETVAAVDRRTFTLEAGRVTADASFVLRFKAVGADGVRIRDIPVTIREAIPEPVFKLKAPAKWNGRDPIEVVPEIANLEAMKAKGAGKLSCTWTVTGGAVVREVAPDRLVLKRSQYTGPITVKAAINNGGADTVVTASIKVTEPAKDPWMERKPEKDEKPEHNQFYARDDRNEGTLHYRGTLTVPADSVYLKVYADGRLVKTLTQKPMAEQTYAFAVRLKAGLVKYSVEFGTRTGGTETPVQTVTNLICGDAYLIDGQSNAEACGPNNGPSEDPVGPVNEWIRSYGNYLNGTTNGGWGNAVRMHIWGRPNCGQHSIGAWGMVLATNLVTRHGIPVCIINGAIGGTQIWQHQPNPANHYDTSGEFYRNPYKIYGCLLTRVAGARLTHGIRGVLWHQGENDSGAGAPTGDWNYKSYQQYFIDMAAAWKTDYPNIRHYYVFQVWPFPACMGPKDDQLRESQRTLSRLFSNLRVMSTVGAAGEHGGRGWCHFDLEGYAMFANFMTPLVEIDNYGLVPKQAVTAPDLRRAWFTGAAKDEIALDFGQPMRWTDAARQNFYLDNRAGDVIAGRVSGNLLILKLKGSQAAREISYLCGRDWNGKPDNLVTGANGIAALTFSGVGIEAGVTAGR